MWLTGFFSLTLTREAKVLSLSTRKPLISSRVSGTRFRWFPIADLLRMSGLLLTRAVTRVLVFLSAAGILQC